MATPRVPNWQAQILRGVGAPVTPQNIRFMNAWAQAEGGTAANNPFNTTQVMPGATAYNNNNGDPVKNYLNPAQGIAATIMTLKNGNYGPIIAALDRGNSAMADAQAEAQTPWGTGSLIEKVLGGRVTGGVPTSGAPVAAGASPAGNSAALAQSLMSGNINTPSLMSPVQSLIQMIMANNTNLRQNSQPLGFQPF